MTMITTGIGLSEHEFPLAYIVTLSTSVAAWCEMEHRQLGHCIRTSTRSTRFAA